MAIIDYVIIFTLLAILFIIAFLTRQYTKTVVNFLAAGRCAGRYLLTVSEGVAGMGAISIVAGFEMYYNAGFAAVWWQFMIVTATTIVMLSGWIVYRFRQTKALTLAQFLEVRYSKNFRIFAGILAWLSGIINFGIFPSVGSRFFIHFFGLPDTFAVYAITMATLILIALFFTNIGGQIAVIMTDFVQGVFCNIAIVVLVAVLLFKFDFSLITSTMMETDKSLINPFQIENQKDFSIWFYLIWAFGFFYRGMIWQGNQGYNTSAISPHEARMGKILGTWRILTLNLMLLVIPICAYTFIHNPAFADQIQPALEKIESIANPQIQKQMAVPIIARQILPIGALGAMAALMLAAFISTHDTYLHSWGSIFIQDVVVPLYGKELSPKAHIKLLRFSILFVAIFIFCFSLLFRQTDYIYMFMMITGAIFSSGAGAVVIGGLYWKRGTTAAAWTATILGAVLSTGSIVLRQIHTANPFDNSFLALIGSQNGATLTFFSCLIALSSYIIVSLLDTVINFKEQFNLDKMLHRGKYREDGLEQKLPPTGIRALIGVTEEFTKTDKAIYFTTMLWTISLVAMFIFGCIYNTFFTTQALSWITLWKYYVVIIFCISAVTTVWFIIGGLFDAKKLFKLLAKAHSDTKDDGVVR